MNDNAPAVYLDEKLINKISQLNAEIDIDLIVALEDDEG